MADIHLRDEFGYVLLVVVATALFFFYTIYTVAQFRMKFKVKPPKLYVSVADGYTEEDANAYNCVQRAFQNNLEALPLFLVTLLVAGIEFPIIAASLGAIYTVARFIYFFGYTSGDANKRVPGMFWTIALLALTLVDAWVAIRLILHWN